MRAKIRALKQSLGEQELQFAEKITRRIEGTKKAVAGQTANPLTNSGSFRWEYSNHAEMKGISRMWDALSSRLAS
jgi:hypothetical protein